MEVDFQKLREVWQRVRDEPIRAMPISFELLDEPQFDDETWNNDEMLRRRIEVAFFCAMIHWEEFGSGDAAGDLAETSVRRLFRLDAVRSKIAT